MFGPQRAEFFVFFNARKEYQSLTITIFDSQVEVVLWNFKRDPLQRLLSDHLSSHCARGVLNPSYLFKGTLSAGKSNFEHKNWDSKHAVKC